MKQILISIKPKWVAKILNGEKTLEIRKTAPKEWADYLNGKTDKPESMIVNIYCTKGDYIGHIAKRYVGKVVGKVVLYAISRYYKGFNVINGRHYTVRGIPEASCLTIPEIIAYASDLSFYAWHISELEIFDEPKKLSEFKLTRAPQSWCYVEELL